MEIRKADPADLEAVVNITRDTIKAVYPHYYPKGAVDFFLWLHSAGRIEKDIPLGKVYLLYDGGIPVGTISLQGEHINRLFVLPEYQGKGYGGVLLAFGEEAVGGQYGKIVLDSSLPGKAVYLKRGYRVAEYKTEQMENGDVLCWDVMEKPWP